LPDLAVEPVALDLVDHDPVGVAEDLEALRGHLAEAADGEPRARERLSIDHLLRHAELEPDRPHLVLEEVAQRLDELEAQAWRQAADVVVGLDLAGGPSDIRRGPLDDVGIHRALGEEVAPAQAGGFSLEYGDELT